MLTTDEARARVAKGAAHLDDVRPDWFNRIDVGTLTLRSHCSCIVGQLGAFGKGYYKEWMEVFDAQHDAMECGVFISPGAGSNEAYARLQDAWIDAIADRRLSQESATAPTLDAVDPAVRQPISVATRA